jgi:hypothetical protein
MKTLGRAGAPCRIGGVRVFHVEQQNSTTASQANRPCGGLGGWEAAAQIPAETVFSSQPPPVPDPHQ